MLVMYIRRIIEISHSYKAFDFVWFGFVGLLFGFYFLGGGVRFLTFQYKYAFMFVFQVISKVYSDQMDKIYKKKILKPLFLQANFCHCCVVLDNIYCFVFLK